MNCIKDFTQQNYIIIISILLFLIIFIIICIFIFSTIFLLLLVIGYILFHFHDFNKTGNFIQKNDYDEITKQYLVKYGDYKIQNVYLIKDYFSNYFISILNYATFFKYNKLIHNVPPFHSMLLLVVSNENESKLIIVHKLPNIILTDKIHIKPTSHIQKIPIRSNKYSIKKMLSSIKNKMGNKYFNWTIVDNNCQDFSKEIIHFLKKKEDITMYIQENVIQKVLNEYNYAIYDVYIMNVLSSIIMMYYTSFSFLIELLIQ